jgi:hypothetical protein
MKFRLKVKDDQGNTIGDHYDGAKKYVGGQVIETSKPLDTIFRGKFEKVEDETPVSAPEIVRTLTYMEEKKKEEKRVVDEIPVEGEVSAPKVNKVKKHGLDVTDDFTGASLHGMKVYLEQSTGLYKIMDADSEAILKKARDEKSVKKYLKSLA